MSIIYHLIQLFFWKQSIIKIVFPNYSSEIISNIRFIAEI
jgi:hypothetical protein